MDLPLGIPPRLSRRFEQALVCAFQLHRDQTRKGTHTPYIAHLLAVASLVIEDGGDEDQAIAALLHDAVEDQGGRVTLEKIKTRFGERVAWIVEGCSDTDTLPKPPWRERKEAYLEHLRGAAAEIRRVSLADKLHNARSILADLRQSRDGVWKRFSGGKEGTLWYYRSLVEIFSEAVDGRMVVELKNVVYEIEKLSA
jgi:(p)ppGpp synthase/HD superfamily hydrolase